MSQYEETFNTWNKMANLYQEKFMKLDLYNETYEVICDSITKENACLLEIGCGPGNITKYLLDKRSDFKILGIDVAPNMIALAKQNNPTASFEVMDARKISRLHTKFDGIIAGFCIPYFSITETEQFIADAKYLLNDRGIIYISFVEGDASASGFKQNNDGDKVYFYYHQLIELNTLLDKNGFEQIGIFKVDFSRSPSHIEVHTILVARKLVN